MGEKKEEKAKKNLKGKEKRRIRRQNEKEYQKLSMSVTAV